LKSAQSWVQVTALATPLLVPLVEEDWLDHEASRLIVREYVEPLKAAQVDTVVLGCTHYPLLKGVLAEELGSEVKLVDSAENAAKALANVLQSQSLGIKRMGTSDLKLFVSDVPEIFGRLAEKFLGRGVQSVQCVPLD
jgi:glutamate racemase